MQDVNKSPGYLELEKLHKDGAISKAEMDLFKSKYAKLHEYVLTTLKNESEYLTRAKQLNNRLMSEKIKLEKTTLESQEDQHCIQQLTDQISEIQNEYDIVQERDMMLQIQLSELQHEKSEKLTQLEEHEKERQEKAEPQIQKCRDEVEQLQKEIEVLRRQKENYQQTHEEYTNKCRQIDEETKNNQELHESHETEHNKIKGDPDRIRKQAEKFGSAVHALMQSQESKKAEIEAANEARKKNSQAQRELEEKLTEAKFTLGMMVKSADRAEQSVDEAKKKLEKEKNESSKLLLKRLSLDQELQELHSESRSALGDLSLQQKQFEKLKRSYKKSQQNKESVLESFGPLKMNKDDLDNQIKRQDEEIGRQKRLLEDIQTEVDLFLGAYLKQDNLEKDQKEEYDSICEKIQDKHKELKELKSQEHQWIGHFKSLASQREKLAREASNAHRKCRETEDEVAMKQLEEDELKKKHQEISQMQKDYCSMYEVVKNERNKYMTQIQQHSQYLSEMKEKMKILNNEVEILKMESASKDEELKEIRKDADELKVAKRQLLNEKTRITSRQTALNEQVEQYVIEIDNLNSIINSIQKEMVLLKRKYEQAIETRNFKGTQLIDRNDELCILWEKANIQERLLKRGEAAMLARTEEIRGLKIDLAEVQRQLRVVRGRIPEVPKLTKEAVSLREQVAIVKKRTDDLSRELENPNSLLRKWQPLSGEKADPGVLRLRIENLEERLNDKKERLLEKELILEEVSALSEKLRQQAASGRQDTMELSQKVNVFQARIKDVTRKMMATVSELSMYQSQAHKLKQDRDDVVEKAMTARERLQRDEAPTDTADAEFERMLQMERQKELDRQAAAQAKQEDEIMNSNFTRTTAEPRVNAYISAEEHGLPKAYGNSAPFKPTVQGSTMRHIRKPNPKPVEL